MPRQLKRAGAAALAAATAAALTAGLTAAPPAAVTTKGDRDGTQAYQRPAHTWVTLITGDRVAVDAEGRATAVRRAPGREGIPMQVQEADGHTYVVPLDAAALVRKGRVDRRLFDVTLQNRPEYRERQRTGLRLIVGYRGARPAAKAKLHAADGTEVEHSFERLDAESVTTRKAGATAAWNALTNAPGGEAAAPRTAESGVDRIWLDGVRRASLDTSVPQIGAPAAWEAGYDGTGVKIAVLDTGVDATHADLAEQVVASENFSEAPDDKDRFGHGTHVASIAAGTGARSGGKFTGVAPGATLLAGKVLDDDGFGDEAGILAGFEWAVGQGADIVNLSLGGPDSPGTDPLEEAVDRISAEEGVLFAIAAGNDGEFGPRTVSSPGSADAALTVGAVDDDDRLADFSSRGPRIGDGAVKPDVTAPGVDTTAAAAPGSVIDDEVGQDPEGYLTISGTSMAAPHAAGAAALLAQQHPDWTGAELKAALTASTEPGAGYSAYEQGSGRIAVDRALEQTVVADPVSLSFGTQPWPHQDDEPVTRTVTYRNLGDQDVTLELAATGIGPDGEPAPAGMFSVGQEQVTVPAGGTAEVPVTADTRPGGSLDGAYSVYVTATGGGQSVRTAGGVEREVESYDLTLTHLGRDGQPTADHESMLVGLSGPGIDVWDLLYDPSGTVTTRVPAGRYLLSSSLLGFSGNQLTALDWINQPKLVIDRDREITIDARTARPVDVTVPDKGAKPTFASLDMEVDVGGAGRGIGWWLDSFAGVRTAHLGPAAAKGELHQQIQEYFARGKGTEFALAYGSDRNRMWTGFTDHARWRDLAKVKTTLGASARGKQGMLMVIPWTGGWSSSSYSAARSLPHSGSVYVTGDPGVRWEMDFLQFGGDFVDTEYRVDPRTYGAGKNYRQTFNVGVFGPLLRKGLGIHRKGNRIETLLPVFIDGQGHAGYSDYDRARTTLYRNGKKLTSVRDLPVYTDFKVPPRKAAYKLTTTATRPASVATVTTKVTAAWTFTSAKTAERTKLPASVVRFAPALAPDSTARARATMKIPVTVQGSAAGRNLRSLKVWASYDGGGHWKAFTVRKGKVKLINPKHGRTVSFKARAVDKRGNTGTQTIYDAYRSR